MLLSEYAISYRSGLFQHSPDAVPRRSPVVLRVMAKACSLSSHPLRIPCLRSLAHFRVGIGLHQGQTTSGKLTSLTLLDIYGVRLERDAKSSRPKNILHESMKSDNPLDMVVHHVVVFPINFSAG